MRPIRNQFSTGRAQHPGPRTSRSDRRSDARVEIPADDTAKGREFWGSLFGWKFDAAPGSFGYPTTQISDQTTGAVTNMESGKRRLRVYFDVDEINAGAERVKDLGGKADEPRPVPGRGWFAVCQDTQGNDFGLWQNDPSAPAPPEYT